MCMSAGIEWHVDETGEPHGGRVSMTSAEAMPVAEPLDTSSPNDPGAGTIDLQTMITRLRALGYTGMLGTGNRPALPAEAPLAVPRATPGR